MNMMRPRMIMMNREDREVHDREELVGRGGGRASTAAPFTRSRTGGGPVGPAAPLSMETEAPL